MRVQAEVPESAPAEEKAGQKRSRLFYEAANVEHYKTAKTMKARALKIYKMHEGVHTKSFEPAVSQPKGGNTNSMEETPIRLSRRARDKKVRVHLSPKAKKRIYSNCHKTRAEALECLLARTGEKLRSGSGPISGIAPSCDVPIVHQIHGFSNWGDRKESALSKLSSAAWQEYARREGCRYILWGPEELAPLVQKYARPDIVEMYRGVKYMAQRVDIARFIVLHAYGGIYADLSVLPNRDRYPQVPLGLCARPSRAKCHSPEWTIDVVVAARANSILRRIVENMIKVTGETKESGCYSLRGNQYINQTTGPYSVAKFLKAIGCASTITLFPITRPIKGLQNHIVQHESGKWVLDGVVKGCFEDYDFLSAFCVYRNAKTISGYQVPLLSPCAQLPPCPEEDYPCPTEKTEEGTGCEPTGKPAYEEPTGCKPTGDDTGTATAPYQPQGQELAAPSAGQGSGSYEVDAAHSAFLDMVRLFQDEQMGVLNGVNVSYRQLQQTTQDLLDRVTFSGEF